MTLVLKLHSNLLLRLLLKTHNDVLSEKKEQNIKDVTNRHVYEMGEILVFDMTVLCKYSIPKEPTDYGTKKILSPMP